MIYRGARMINWDPAAKTALSDEGSGMQKKCRVNCTT